MTPDDRFTEQEWRTIAGAPLLAAMAVIAARRGGRVRETLAVTRAYADARGRSGSRLLGDLLTAAPAPAVRRPEDGEQLRREALAALRDATGILDRVATAHERQEYTRFVLSLADAARARRGGGLLRRGRAAVPESERQTLAEIATALGATHAA